MKIQVLSIKQAKEELKNVDISKIKLIIASSYENDIEFVSKENKLLLKFDDINDIKSKNAFNMHLAKEIHNFINKIDSKKDYLYVCCDSGISRSSAIVAAILRKYNKNEDIIWKNCNYHPNLLVYEKLCAEFNLKNSKIRLRRKEKINANSLKRQINKTRNLNKNIFRRLLNI